MHSLRQFAFVQPSEEMLVVLRGIEALIWRPVPGMARETLARAFWSWPRSFSSASGFMRKTMSLPAPAGNLLTIVIGWLAHRCAPAGEAAKTRNTTS
jgi:hypothetical protein